MNRSNEIDEVPLQLLGSYKSNEEISRYIVDETFKPCEKAIFILEEGTKDQKQAILTYLDRYYDEDG